MQQVSWRVRQRLVLPTTACFVWQANPIRNNCLGLGGWQPLPELGAGKCCGSAIPTTHRSPSRASLQLLDGMRVICDERFSLLPNGEQQSLIPWWLSTRICGDSQPPKLYGIVGLGYAVRSPSGAALVGWWDPWPRTASLWLLANGCCRLAYRRWCKRCSVGWRQQEPGATAGGSPGIISVPSAVNYLLIRSNRSLVPLREAMEQRHRILLHCCSFAGWARPADQGRAATTVAS